MSGFSNFISNFGGLVPTADLMSLVSNAIQVETSTGHSGTYYARYLCIGNLLIQFTDASNGSVTFNGTSGTDYGYTYFPIPYDTAPYVVFTTPFVGTGNPANSANIMLSVNGWTVSNFGWNINSISDYSIFYMAIGPRPQVLYNSTNYQLTNVSNASVYSYTNTYFNSTNYTTVTYYGLVIQNTNLPGGSSANVTLTFPSNLYNVNMLVVGGGGGGGASNSITGGGTGGGGGGGATNLIFTSTLNCQYPVTVTVGCGGTGGYGNSGNNGGNSSISFYANNNGPNISYTSGGGYGGYATETNGNITSVAGGNGGSTTQTNGNSGYGSGGGGGGGGGGSGYSTVGGNGGSNDTNSNNGIGGVTGTVTQYYQPVGGNGGSSYLYNTTQNGVFIPFYNANTNVAGTYVNTGGGGAGCGSYGGECGNGFGGSSTSNTTDWNGISGLNTLPTSSSNGSYGGGGGGASYSQQFAEQYTGGNGGNGVVMIWWQVMTS